MIVKTDVGYEFESITQFSDDNVGILHIPCAYSILVFILHILAAILNPTWNLDPSLNYYPCVYGSKHVKLGQLLCIILYLGPEFQTLQATSSEITIYSMF